MSYRTPLARVTQKGTARGGTDHFIHQRVTGMSNIVLTLFFLWFVARLAGQDRADMVDLLRNPLIAVALILAILSVTYHMRIGMQVIIEDYVHSDARKFPSLLFNLFYPIAIAALSVVSILKLSFGGP